MTDNERILLLMAARTLQIVTGDEALRLAAEAVEAETNTGEHRMGTNYYVIDGEKPCCECGQTVPNKVHIGKTSAGWRFLAWAGPGRPRTWEALREALRHRAVVLDEYGGVLTGEDLIRGIEIRAGLKSHIPCSRLGDWSDGPADFTEAVFS